MESQSQSTKPNKKICSTDRLSLDDYLSFIDSHKQLNLPVKLLHQVIHMHGFRLIKKPKKLLIDAVNAIDLMDPSRSTLKDENLSSCAFMTLEETIKDLALLNWHECCVTSIQTVSSAKYDLVLHNSSTPAPTNSKPNEKSRKRRKFFALCDVAGGGAATEAANSCGGTGGSQAVSSSAAAGDGYDADFGSTFGDVTESSSTLLSITSS